LTGGAEQTSSAGGQVSSASQSLAQGTSDIQNHEINGIDILAQ
jgi:hypothetical protein